MTVTRRGAVHSPPSRHLGVNVTGSLVAAPKDHVTVAIAVFFPRPYSPPPYIPRECPVIPIRVHIDFPSSPHPLSNEELAHCRCFLLRESVPYTTLSGVTILSERERTMNNSSRGQLCRRMPLIITQPLLLFCLFLYISGRAKKKRSPMQQTTRRCLPGCFLRQSHEYNRFQLFNHPFLPL